MGPFLRELKEDHTLILNVVNFISAFAKDPSLDLQTASQLVEFLEEYVGGYHHRKEEEILFPFLHSINGVKTGGPLCGLFMQYFLQGNPTQSLLRDGKNRFGHKQSETIRDIFRSKSFLTIPLEEHLAGHICIEQMKHGLHELQKYSNKNILLNAFGKYVELLRLHIRKENECLFVMADEAVAAEIQEKMLEKSNQLKTHFGLNKLRAFKNFSLSLAG
jgi:hemerythrin-like domain-containing protein